VESTIGAENGGWDPTSVLARMGSVAQPAPLGGQPFWSFRAALCERGLFRSRAVPSGFLPSCAKTGNNPGPRPGPGDVHAALRPRDARLTVGDRLMNEIVHLPHLVDPHESVHFRKEAWAVPRGSVAKAT